MTKQLEAQYPLFDSVEEMLSPESLGGLLAKPITRIEARPMNGHSGLAGGHLSYVDTNDGRLVLKRMSIEDDWIIFASDDHQCRSVTLWQYGLLDQLRPHLEHKIVSCSRDGAGWAILMHDLTGSTFTWDEPMAPELVPTFLDTMARIHATFWNDSRLKSSELGLCSPASLLDQSALPMARQHPGSRLSPIPEWVRRGWDVMAELLEPEAFASMYSLIENPQPLFDVLERYSFTLLHGDYRAENLAHLKSGEVVALDWQEAACSLMTIDLAWFVKNGYVQEAMPREQAISFYRSCLEGYLNTAFDDLDWRAMLDLGQCLDALRSACFHAFFYKHDTNPASQLFNESLVRRQGQHVADAMRWL